MSFWYYLSFADDTGFLGGCYVSALSQAGAVLRAHQLGINPGGEVQIVGPLPPDALDSNVPVEMRGRLLSRDEVEAH